MAELSWQGALKFQADVAVQDERSCVTCHAIGECVVIMRKVRQDEYQSMSFCPHCIGMFNDALSGRYDRDGSESSFKADRCRFCGSGFALVDSRCPDCGAFEKEV